MGPGAHSPSSVQKPWIIFLPEKFELTCGGGRFRPTSLHSVAMRISRRFHSSLKPAPHSTMASAKSAT